MCTGLVFVLLSPLALGLVIVLMSILVLHYCFLFVSNNRTSPQDLMASWSFYDTRTASLVVLRWHFCHKNENRINRTRKLSHQLSSHLRTKNDGARFGTFRCRAWTPRGTSYEGAGSVSWSIIPSTLETIPTSTIVWTICWTNNLNLPARRLLPEMEHYHKQGMRVPQLEYRVNELKHQIKSVMDEYEVDPRNEWTIKAHELLAWIRL